MCVALSAELKEEEEEGRRKNKNRSERIENDGATETVLWFLFKGLLLVWRVQGWAERGWGFVF